VQGIAIVGRIGAARILVRQRVVPLLLCGTVAAFFVLPDNVALNKTYYAAVAPLTLFALGAADFARLWRATTLRWITAFIAFMTLSAAWTSGEPAESTRALLLFGVSTLIFVLLICACDRNWFDRLLPWCAGVTTLHIGVISAAWYMTHAIDEPLEAIGRLDHPLELASVYASMAAMSLVRYTQAPGPRRSPYLVTVVACVVAILLTGRRGPLLAFAAVGLLAVTYQRSAHATKLIAALLIGCAALLLLEPALMDQLTERGTSLRPAIWIEGWQRIRDDGAWVFGNGAGASTALEVGNLAVRHYHDIFLSTLFYGGLVGATLLFGILAATVIDGLRVPASQPWLAALCAGVGCLMTNGDRLVIHPHPVWLYFWLPATVVAIYSSSTSGPPAKTT
jgi:hypothetical protein